MKHFILLSLLSLSAMSTYAGEYDMRYEVKCAAEAEKIGCQGTDAQITSCLDMKKQNLSNECSQLHESKKKEQ